MFWLAADQLTYTARRTRSISRNYLDEMFKCYLGRVRAGTFVKGKLEDIEGALKCMLVN